ncbi:MAG: tyrosine-type recombinase/integrase [Alphaproteobacteria bacterium]|nr:tyrosine-type recombinase/integrase [Alphaproteobacteria bacterium]
MKLNETICKNAKPGEKAQKLADGLGLYLEITPKGGKYWRMKYRHLGKEKRLAFGVYPEVSLKEAREKRDKARKLIAESKDPSYVKRRHKEQLKEEAGNTFEKIAREWHKHNKPEWKPEHAETILKRLERDVFPAIGEVPIKELTPKMLLDMAKGIQTRGANELAKRVIQMSRHIFQYAIITGRAEKNIAEDLKGLIKPKPKKHFASLDPQELPEFLGALYSNEARLMPLTHLAVQFMMLTFVRTNEMIKAEWDEIDLDERMWLIPAHRMKMKKEHLVPLSDQAIEVLKKIRKLHGNQTYVFPSRENSQNHMSNNTILMALRRMGYGGKMTGHGFRALAMSAIMEKLSYRFEVPDRQLAHSKRGDVNKAYDRAMFLDERKVMMQDWANYLDKIRK